MRVWEFQIRGNRDENDLSSFLAASEKACTLAKVEYCPENAGLRPQPAGFPRHISSMATPRHYVPTISRPVVAALFHEAKRHRIPMTRLVDCLLRESLRGTPGWTRASRDWPELAALQRPDRPRGLSLHPNIRAPRAREARSSFGGRAFLVPGTRPIPTSYKNHH